MTKALAAVDSGEETRQLDDVSSRLQEMGEKFGTAIGYMSSFTQSLDATVDRIGTEVIDALGGLQFQDVTRQQLEHVAAALDRFDAHMEMFAAAVEQCVIQPLEIPPMLAQLDELFSGYAMNGQRQAHREATGTAPAACDADLKVELF